MTKHYTISSKTEKWDLHVTKSQGAKTPFEIHQYQIKIINSVKVIQKYEKCLMKFRRILRNTKIK